MLGKVSPSGRLGANWPRYVAQVGTGASPFLARRVGKWLSNKRGDIDPDGRRYDPFCDRNDPATPLFRFGWGLSYTTWAYSNVSISLSGDPNAPVVLHVDLENTGTVDAAEVVQVYCQEPHAGASNVVRHWKRLTAFQRVELSANAKRAVQLPLLASELGSHDDNMNFRIASGEFNCSVGGSSITDSLLVSFSVPESDTQSQKQQSTPSCDAAQILLEEKDQHIADLEEKLRLLSASLRNRVDEFEISR